MFLEINDDISPLYNTYKLYKYHILTVLKKAITGILSITSFWRQYTNTNLNNTYIVK